VDVSLTVVCPFACGLMLVVSATAARGKLGPVQDLYLQTVGSWGTHAVHSVDDFRYVSPQHPDLFDSTSGILTKFDTSSRHGVVDLLAFSIVLITTRRSRGNGHPTIPRILDIILRDATRYFMLIFSAHVLSVLFLLFAPVSRTRYIRVSLVASCSSHAHAQINIQLLPGM
jgi:hypothetical protein